MATKLYTYDELANSKFDPNSEQTKYLAKLRNSGTILNTWATAAKGIKGYQNYESGKAGVLKGIERTGELARNVDRYINWNMPGATTSTQASAMRERETAIAEINKRVESYAQQGFDWKSTPTYKKYAQQLGLDGGTGQTAQQTAAETQAGVNAEMVRAGQDPTTGATIDKAKNEAYTVAQLQQSGQTAGNVDANGKLIQYAPGTTVGADGKPIETAPNGQPVEAQGLGGQTIDEIQASPIPPLPEGYGAGSGLSQVDWALQHRQNIFNAYQKYGITPTAEEVNWQLTHNPDINSIEQSIAQAVSSGQDTRGKMPEGSEADSKAKSVVDAITSTDANGQEKPLADVVKEFTDSMGLTEISDQLQAVDDAMGDEIMAINENPWLSEAERSKRIQLTEAKYESKKNSLIERLKLQEDAVARAVDYYEKDREYKKEIIFKTLDMQNKELDRQLEMEMELSKTQTSFQTADGRNLMITYDRNGKVVNTIDLGGAYKASSGGGGGGGSAVSPSTGMTVKEEATFNNNFDKAVRKAQTDLDSGKTSWGDVWNDIYAEFGGIYSNAEIDAALGGGYNDSTGQYWGRANTDNKQGLSPNIMYM